MADFNMKTATPDTSIPNDSAGLIGADSQAAAAPSWYSFGTIRTWVQSVVTAMFPAWATYTPTLANDGGGGTFGTAVGNYLVVPLFRIVFIQVKATCTNATGASGKVYFGYPPSYSIDTTYLLGQVGGRENGVSGKYLIGLMNAATIIVGFYDDTSAIATNAQINVSGWYRY